MGKAARTKAARRTSPPPPVGKSRPRDNRQLLIAGAAALAGIVAVVVVVLVVTSGGSKTPPPAAATGADKSAPAALVAAANKVGFHPNTEAGVGTIEDKPVSAAGPPSNPNLISVGAKAPDFTLKTPQGQSYSLSQYRGKQTVLIEFFATWCPHCDAEAPHLHDLYASLPKGKFQFLGVNADGEDAASVYAYHRYFGLQFPALLDPSSQPGSFKQPGAAGPVTTQYQVQSFPTFYVVDKHGVIQWRSDGEQPDALLRQQLLAAAKH
jgi:peroxiredoxin